MKRKKPFPAQIIRTPSGEEMVILAKRDYDALVSIVQKGGKGLGAIPSTIKALERRWETGRKNWKYRLFLVNRMQIPHNALI